MRRLINQRTDAGDKAAADQCKCHFARPRAMLRKPHGKGTEIDSSFNSRATTGPYE